jgi:hypothetical protein
MLQKKRRCCFKIYNGIALIKKMFAVIEDNKNRSDFL